MAIISPDQLTNALLLDAAAQTQRLLNAAAAQGNQMVSVLLRLDNAALTEWLNGQSQQDLSSLFADHASVGSAINSALFTVTAQIAASGTVMKYEPVDVRTIQAKLADQGRKVEIVDGQFVVSNIQ